MGVTLYAEQQELAQAQAKLEKYNQDLEKLTADRLVREAELRNIRKLYKNMVSASIKSRQQGIDIPS